MIFHCGRYSREVVVHLSGQTSAGDGIIHAFNEDRRLLELAPCPLGDDLGALRD